MIEKIRNDFIQISKNYEQKTGYNYQEELDAYVLGEFEPLDTFTGKVIAIIRRINDNDDKLVVVKEDKNYTDEQIRALVEFQEQFFEFVIIR